MHDIINQDIKINFGVENKLYKDDNVIDLDIYENLKSILSQNDISNIYFAVNVTSSEYLYFHHFFSYLCIDNLIQWNVDILAGEYSLQDLIDTYKDGNIVFYTEEPTGLGAGTAESVIEFIAIALASGVLYDIVKYVFKNIKNKYYQNEMNIARAMMCKDIWNLDDFYNSFEFETKEHARCFLKGLGYIYDNSIKAYTIDKDKKNQAIKLIDDIYNNNI